MNPMTVDEFAEQIKNKYPEYKDFNNKELTEKVIAKYPVYRSQVQGFEKKTFVQDAKADIKQITQDFSTDLESRADKFGEADQTANPLRRGFQKFGQAAGAASDLIGRTVLGVGKAVLPQAVEDKVSRGAQKVGTTIAESRPAQEIASRLSEVKRDNPTLARDIDAALGIGMLGLDVGTAGLTGSAAKGTGRVIGAGAGKVTDTLAAGGTGGVRLASEVQGVLTGTGGESLRQAFNAAYKGGKDLSTFTDNLRGRVTPETLVQTVRENVGKVQAARNSDFTRTLSTLGDRKVNTVGLRETVENNLRDFNIDVKDGALDFSKSKFSTVPQARTKLQEMYGEITRLGNEEDLVRVDTSRQALRNLLLAGDDGSANTANAIITDAIDAVRDTGKQVDGYESMLNRFASESEFLDELNQSLSTGNKASIETAFKKLTVSLRTNNEQRLALLKELDQATGGTILSQVAGQQMSELLPRGIFRQVALSLAGASAVIPGGVALAPTIVTSLLAVSPRVAGETIRALGITGRKLTTFLDSLEAVRKVLRQMGIDPQNIKVPLPSATVQGFTPDEEESTP